MSFRRRRRGPRPLVSLSLSLSSSPTCPFAWLRTLLSCTAFSYLSNELVLTSIPFVLCLSTGRSRSDVDEEELGPEPVEKLMGKEIDDHDEEVVEGEGLGRRLEEGQAELDLFEARGSADGLGK